MFWRKYTLSCWECNKEYTFGSVKELHAFRLGSNGLCPVCGSWLHPTPLKPSNAPMPKVYPSKIITGSDINEQKHTAD